MFSSEHKNQFVLAKKDKLEESLRQNPRIGGRVTIAVAYYA